MVADNRLAAVRCAPRGGDVVTPEGWVLGTWTVLWIAGYVRWAKRQDAAERYRDRRDTPTHNTKENKP